MEYRVEELATAADLRVDTIRFYQSRGLLPKPLRRGRQAIYLPEHLEVLRRIRRLGEQGFTLAQIDQILNRSSSPDSTEPLLEALVEEELGDRTYSRAELAQKAGVPEALIQAVASAGLGFPVEIDGESRFTEADLEMARSARAILEAGFPLDELMKLAVCHAEHVQGVADSAIDLFDDHIRKSRASGPAATLARFPVGRAMVPAVGAEGVAGQGQDTPSGERPLRVQGEVAQAFRHLLPHVTRLVALHFQRTLIGRAIERLAESGDEERDDLRRALATTRSGRLQVEWR